MKIADDGGDMSEKTILVVPGKKMSVPRPLKRSLQIAAAVALTAGVALAILVGNGLLVPRGHLLQGWDVWVTFINRTDILATMVLTALVTVLFVYWQRDHERGK
jgi:branched-subunit amino acid transport protein